MGRRQEARGPRGRVRPGCVTIEYRVADKGVNATPQLSFYSYWQTGDSETILESNKKEEKWPLIS